MKDSLPETPDDLQQQIAALQAALLHSINDSFEKSGKIDRLAEQINDLQISQRQTDGHLNAVTIMAEKFFSGENGDSKKLEIVETSDL